jgi:hypothetical protein
MGELLQSKPDGFASSLGEGAFGKEEKLYRTAKGPISEGAVTAGGWGSFITKKTVTRFSCNGLFYAVLTTAG